MAITHSLVDTDWEIDSATGNIRYTGDDHNGTSPSYATVIEFHRWLWQLADDQTPANNDDELYMPMLGPSSRSTDNIVTLINGYNINAAAAEHLYDGSIIQSGGDEIWDGIVNYGNANVQLQIIQDGAVIADDYWNYNIGGTADSGNGTTLTDSGAFTGEDYSGYTFRNTTDACRGIATSNTDNAITFASGELYGTGTKDFDAADAYLIGVPLNPDSAQGISHRFMVKVRSDGADIDGRRLMGICRRPGNTFYFFPINGTGRGNNVLACSDATDNNYDTANQTVMGGTWDTAFSGEDQGFQQFDVDADSTNEDYFGKLSWTPSGSYDINDLYMRAMGETCDSGGYTVHGLDGEVLRGVTHSCGYDNEFVMTDYDLLSWGTYVNTGVVTDGPFTVGEVITDDVATPTFYARVLSVDASDTSLVVSIDSGTLGNGIAIVGVSSGATATTSADPTEKTGGGVLHVLANDTTNDIIYVQVLKGTMPADDDLLYDCGAGLGSADHTATTQVADEVDTITAYEINKAAPYIGASTGTAIIGAHGVGIDETRLALTSANKVLPLGESDLISPPTTITNTYTGLVVAEDYILIGPTDGTTTDENGDPTMGQAFLTLSSDNTGASVSDLAVNETLTGDLATFMPSGSPGYITIIRDDGTVTTHPYDSYDSDSFTLNPAVDFTAPASASTGNLCFVGQMHLDTALTTSSESAVAVNDIVGSTPDSGTLRVVNDDGYHVRVNYSSYDDGTDAFTLVGADTFVDANVDTGTEEVEITSHAFQSQMPVTLTTTGTLPAPLALATTYYIIYSDADNIQFAADLEDAANGTAVNITSAAGGGTHTITPNYIDFSGDNYTEQAAVGASVYVTYLDHLASATSESFQAIYDNDLELTVSVRDGGGTPIKEDKKRHTLTNANASLGITRTSDT